MDLPHPATTTLFLLFPKNKARNWKTFRCCKFSWENEQLFLTLWLCPVLELQILVLLRRINLCLEYERSAGRITNETKASWGGSRSPQNCAELKRLQSELKSTLKIAAKNKEPKTPKHHSNRRITFFQFSLDKRKVIHSVIVQHWQRILMKLVQLTNHW